MCSITEQMKLAAHGDLKQLIALHYKFCAFQRGLPSAAQNASPLYHDGIVHKAIKYSHLDILKWENEIGYDFRGCVRYAVEYGQIEVLKYFCELGIEFDDTLYFTAAEAGNVEILQMLVDIVGVQPGPSAYAGAIIGNHPNMIEWLFGNNVPFKKSALELAERLRRNEIVKSMKEVSVLRDAQP